MNMFCNEHAVMNGSAMKVVCHEHGLL